MKKPPPYQKIRIDYNRECLWQALLARRVYASTGARSVIHFKANGQWMGSEIEATGTIDFEISVEATTTTRCFPIWFLTT